MAIGWVDLVTHLRVSGHSASAALAYRFGLRLVDSRTGTVHDYRDRSTREDIAETGIESARNTPLASDVQALADAIERAERRHDARILRDWKIALPCELGEIERNELAREIARGIAQRYDTVTAWAVHRPGPDGDERNHHAHIVIPTRALGEREGEFGAKLRVLDNPRTSGDEVAALRNAYADLTNLALRRAGHTTQIDVGQITEGIRVESASHTMIAVARRATGQDRTVASARDTIAAAAAAVHLTSERAARISRDHARGRETTRPPRAHRYATSRRARWERQLAVLELEDWQQPTLDDLDALEPPHLVDRDPDLAAAVGGFAASPTDAAPITAPALTRPTRAPARHRPRELAPPGPVTRPTPARPTRPPIRATLRQRIVSTIAKALVIIRPTRAASRAPLRRLAAPVPVTVPRLARPSTAPRRSSTREAATPTSITPPVLTRPTRAPMRHRPRELAPPGSVARPGPARPTRPPIRATLRQRIVSTIAKALVIIRPTRAPARAPLRRRATPAPVTVPRLARPSTAPRRSSTREATTPTPITAPTLAAPTTGLTIADHLELERLEQLREDIRKGRKRRPAPVEITLPTLDSDRRQRPAQQPRRRTRDDDIGR